MRERKEGRKERRREGGRKERKKEGKRKRKKEGKKEKQVVHKLITMCPYVRRPNQDLTRRKA